jgi:uncharacterized protein
VIHPNTELQFISQAIGYGVFATTAIPKGTIVYVKDVLDIEISPSAFNRLADEYKEIVEKFSYRDQDGVRIVSWDHAKYVNHRCDCNTMSTGYGFEIALRDIKAGEEITDEYGLFNIPIPMEITCGCPDCRNVLKPTDIDIYGDAWDGRVAEALGSLNHIYQPLWKTLDAETKTRLRAYFSEKHPYPSVRCLKYEPKKNVRST